LATSHILWEEGYLDKNQSAIYDTLSGRLEVRRIETKNGVEMQMNFPVDTVTLCKEPIGLDMALDCHIVNTYQAGLDLLVEVADEKTVDNLSPIIQQIAMIPVRCIIVTAKGDDEDCDFVSRVFGPNVGIDEDPVTGSTHCSLTPFWTEKLGKTKMRAKQLSKRGGLLGVELSGDRVNVSGQAVTVFKGELE
jgi:PhzF family phenazine biosynthesis protein